MPTLHSSAAAVVLFLTLAGCAGEPTAVTTTRVFTLTGTLGVPRWNSVDVPGSTETRPGTTLPAFLVCATEDGAQARAAAVIDRGALTLLSDGTAKLELTAGTWWSVGLSSGGSGGSITEFGRWSEATPGTIHLSGFTTAAFDAPLQYTEAGALTAMTFECPGVSTTPRLTSELTFNREPLRSQ